MVVNILDIQKFHMMKLICIWLTSQILMCKLVLNSRYVNLQVVKSGINIYYNVITTAAE